MASKPCAICTVLETKLKDTADALASESQLQKQSDSAQSDLTAQLTQKEEFATRLVKALALVYQVPEDRVAELEEAELQEASEDICKLLEDIKPITWERDSLQKQLKELEQELKRHKDSISTKAGDNEVVKALQKENQELGSQLKGKQTELEQKTIDYLKLRSQFNNANDSVKKLSKEKKNSDDARDKLIVEQLTLLRQLEEETGSLEAKKKDIESFKQELSNLKVKI